MRALVFLAVALISVTSLPAATLEPVSPTPIEGQPTPLVFTEDGVPAEGVAVTARYRENAHRTLQSQQTIGLTDASGRVEWIPERAGVVVLAWDGGTSNVSVLHQGTPPAAVLIAVFAGLLLLGGSATFFVLMIRDGRTEHVDEVEEVGEPPST